MIPSNFKSKKKTLKSCHILGVVKINEMIEYVATGLSIVEFSYCVIPSGIYFYYAVDFELIGDVCQYVSISTCYLY